MDGLRRAHVYTIAGYTLRVVHCRFHTVAYVPGIIQPPESTAGGDHTSRIDNRH